MSAKETPAPVGVPKNLLFKPAPAPAPIPYGGADYLAPAPGPALPKAKPVKAPKAPKAPAPAPAPAGGPGVPLLGAAGTTFTTAVPPDLALKILKPVTGMGGWQRVLLALQGQTASDPSVDPVSGLPVVVYTLTLTPYLLARLISLSVKHGSGGYQAVIRHIVCLAVSQHPTAVLGGPAVTAPEFTNFTPVPDGGAE